VCEVSGRAVRSPLCQEPDSEESGVPPMLPVSLVGAKSISDNRYPVVVGGLPRSLQ